MKRPIGAEPNRPLVLIVEDANFNIHAERMTLESSGYEVMTTETGGTAAALARHHHPDIVIVDLGLPDVSGLTVIEELKADSATRHIPILVCSADDREETIATCREKGAARYLAKPFSAEQFLEAVEEVLAATTPPADTPPSGPIIAA